MTESGAAVAIQMAIPKAKLVRVLVIDDEPHFQQDMRDYFGAYGYSADVAPSINEAKVLLRKHSYQLILADVNFQGALPEGDRFVLQNSKHFKGARVVVVTGLDVNSVRNRNALEELGVPIWDKGDPNWGAKLTELAQQTADASRARIEAEVDEFLAVKLGDRETQYVVKSPMSRSAAGQETRRPWEIAIEAILVDWLGTQADQDQPFLSIGRDVFSAAQMVDEIKSRSTIGDELLEMFITEVRHCVGMGGR